MITAGWGDSEIARNTGIPRSTVCAWRHGRGAQYHRRLALANPHWRPPNAADYAYLLGVYLGDGCLNVTRSGAAALIVSLDAHYPLLADEVERSIASTFDGIAVRRARTTGSREMVLSARHPALPHAFPQHGAGPKHLRAIGLLDWQAALTCRYPKALLRGLIHSDGCRTLNRFTVALPSGRIGNYEYPRYFFSNLSEGIRRIFCEHCELLGIHWTQSNPRNISISQRHSVALLDEFVGPKR